MGGVRRRAFLQGAAAAAAGVGWAPGLWTPARAAGLRRSAAVAIDPAGTTLESTVAIVSTDPSGYVRLGVGPGYPIVVRVDLAEAKAGRDDRRTPLATIGHLTDVHLCDSQSPGRVEFLDRLGPPFDGAQRPHEALTAQVGSAMVRRMNDLAGGPVAGRPLDCVVSTGDNVDNQQHNELAWFLTLLDGGTLVPDSGAIGQYEGVQDGDAGSYDPHYWHPGPVPMGKPADDFKARGYPELPGLLAAAIAPFDTPGLRAPWYSTYGNHDGLVQGNLNGLTLGLPQFDVILTGPIKPMNLSVVPSPEQAAALLADPALLIGALSAVGVPVRLVTPDAGRRAVSPVEWVTAHLGSSTGSHGFSEEHLDGGALDFVFEVAPGVLGASLDTVNRGGYADGSLGASQLAWLEARLAEAMAARQLVVLFSHHNIGTLGNPIPDPAALEEPRMNEAAILAVIRRFDNVVAWVNGHTHQNRVTPVPDPTGATGGFWEITTAAHVDYPVHSRVVEIVYNGDGTLSIFATVLEHAGPAAVDPDDTSVLGLASLSRELAANDPQVNRLGKLGAPTDLNVELLRRSPFTPSGGGAVAPPAPPAPAPTPGASGGVIPATGPLPGLGPAAVALAAAVAVRRRATSDS